MAQRGRPSASSLSVIADGLTARVERPAPPPELNGEQASEWRAIVECMPADWFGRETHGLLIQYCRHVVNARRIAQMFASLQDAEEICLDEWDKLCKMHEREGRAISSLATRMRITQQALVDKRTSKATTKAKRPWES